MANWRETLLLKLDDLKDKISDIRSIVGNKLNTLYNTKADKAITIDTTEDLTGGGDLSDDRVIGLSEEVISDLEDGVEAYSWGNHADENYAKEGDVHDGELDLSTKGNYIESSSTIFTANDSNDKVFSVELTEDAISKIDQAHEHDNKSILDTITENNITNWNNKVDRELGKGLSTNDFRDSDKSKLDSIESGAQANVKTDWSATEGDSELLNKPTLGTASTKNVSDFATAAQGDKADTAVQFEDLDQIDLGFVLDNDNSANNLKITDLSDPTSDLDAANKRYVDDQSVMEALNEGNGVGYRIRGRNPDNYGDIGGEAVDLSWSTTASSTQGATGQNSFTAGQNVTASGNFSVNIGVSGEASGPESIKIGGHKIVSGNFAIGIGSGGSATGSSSISMLSGDANGSNSVVIGNGSANGSYSRDFGYSTISNSYSVVSIGRFNDPITATPQTSWLLGSPLFIVGNGSNNNNRSNAYTLYNDGKSEQESTFEITTPGEGVILSSPNGTRWEITVEDDGSLTTTELN